MISGDLVLASLFSFCLWRLRLLRCEWIGLGRHLRRLWLKSQVVGFTAEGAGVVLFAPASLGAPAISVREERSLTDALAATALGARLSPVGGSQRKPQPRRPLMKGAAPVPSATPFAVRLTQSTTPVRELKRDPRPSGRCRQLRA